MKTMLIGTMPADLCSCSQRHVSQHPIEKVAYILPSDRLAYCEQHEHSGGASDQQAEAYCKSILPDDEPGMNLSLEPDVPLDAINQALSAHPQFRAALEALSARA